MTIAEIAKDFTELLQQGDHHGAAEKYNADEIVSYEAMEGPMAVSHGKEALKQKGQWWQENNEVHVGARAWGCAVQVDGAAHRLRDGGLPLSC